VFERTQPWAERLARHSLTWIGAFDAGRLIGFVHACWDGGVHAFLLDTVVEPTYRHRGIGRVLVQVLVREVTEAGCDWLHVDYEPQLASFYQACGFRPTAAGLLRLSGPGAPPSSVQRDR
jgi:GNAT superfamily N-acetyltransferase